jgi:AGZA family xanthine/uracil permease-like MFS transporter
VIAAITMPLTYSIATGIGLGFITYVLIKLIAGRAKDIPIAVGILAVVFAVKLILVPGG